MEDDLLGLGSTGWLNKELHLYVDKETLPVTNIVWVVWQGNLVAIRYTGEIFGKAGEGRFDGQGKHASRELVEDTAAIVFDLFTYQRLVSCSLGL